MFKRLLLAEEYLLHICSFFCSFFIDFKLSQIFFCNRRRLYGYHPRVQIIRTVLYLLDQFQVYHPYSYGSLPSISCLSSERSVLVFLEQFPENYYSSRGNGKPIGLCKIGQFLRRRHTDNNSSPIVKKHMNRKWRKRKKCVTTVMNAP